MASAFDSANSAGKDKEWEIAKVLMSAGWPVQMKFAGPRYDLTTVCQTSGQPELIEVKNEDANSHTGNACFEITQGAECKPSGLLRSESTVCVHTFGQECLVFRTQIMRLWLQYMIQRNQFSKRLVGDNQNVGVLVPKISFAQSSWAQLTSVGAIPSSRVFSFGLRGVA